MSRLAVLAVSACEQGLLSTQLNFENGGTRLLCGRTYAEAASFLSRYPGAVVICSGQSSSNRSDCLSHLIAQGRPSAVIFLGNPDGNRVRAEVCLIRSEDALRELVENPEAMRKIQLAWEYCKAAYTRFSPADERAVGLPLM